MQRLANSIWSHFMRSVPGIVLAILLVYIYGDLFGTPLVGFLFNPKGEVIQTFIHSTSREDLQPGDKIISIGPVLLDDFYNDARIRIYYPSSPGAVTKLKVLRGSSEQDIDWVIPANAAKEFPSRLFGAWWVGVALYLAGSAAWFLVWPHDVRWRLFVAMMYLAAIAIVAGSVSYWRFLNSHLLMRSAVWIAVPFNIHFHWIYPRPLSKIPTPLIVLGYMFALGLAIAEWLYLLPPAAYAFGVLLLVAGDLTLLVLHIFHEPENRSDLLLLGVVIAISFFPMVAMSITRLTNHLAMIEIPLTLFSLSFIPIIYFYVFFKRSLGGLETRANQAISLYLFSILVLTLGILLFAATSAINWEPGVEFTIHAGSFVLASVIGIISYPTFESWIYQRFLHIPLPPQKLVETFASRLSTALEIESLAAVWQEEILPSLLIRQAAILRFEADQTRAVLLSGVTKDQLPDQKRIHSLLSQKGVYRPPGHERDHATAWVRLVLELSAGGQALGLVLFGRRDPRDYYASTEIPVLQSLTDQTSLALLNIDQANRLRALYQADIGRHENERTHLALELHDDVLQQMALLYNLGAELGAGEQFQTAYQSSVSHMRNIISGLRPSMLLYGLHSALNELAEDDSSQISTNEPINGYAKTEIILDIPYSTNRYPAEIELHLYRIVQQSCQNAINHARASTIAIRGCLDAHSVELEVEDDGIGFEVEGKSDLAQLLVNQHFGLAAIHERAAIIGAQVQVFSAPGEGTRIRVHWKANGNGARQPGDL